MIGPAIDPSQVGWTGLAWLFLSYGYILYYASNLIGEGSELLLLVPSLAGLVGGVVLPLLGAVPDGAIILFSGLGSLEEAQETLSVGVGALAGSTIMLLTIPLTLSVIGGRVDLLPDGKANYTGKPKLTQKFTVQDHLLNTGVGLTDAVQHGGVVMMITTLPYFFIQIPAFFLHGPSEQVAAGEHWWAALAFVLCLTGLIFYLRLQLRISREGEDRTHRMAVMKKLLKEGQVSLSGALASQLPAEEDEHQAGTGGGVSEYQSLTTRRDDAPHYPSPAVAAYLKEILVDAFVSYDSDGNGQLTPQESYTFFRDFHESVTKDEMDELFAHFDTDGSGTISFDEFIGLAYSLIKTQASKDPASIKDTSMRKAKNVMAEAALTDVEEEEIPAEFTDLTPEQQQAAIKKRAFLMLFCGTFLVVAFSDPMVDVMQEIAVRARMSPFYVSFVLAPLTSNASEVLASQYYAAKKTSKTMTVSLSALAGAANMNNTFCLSIFMGLIFFRGLAWQYSAETIAILSVEFIVGLMVQRKSMSVGHALLIGSIFPLSLVLVAVLESFGFD